MVYDRYGVSSVELREMIGAGELGREPRGGA